MSTDSRHTYGYTQGLLKKRKESSSDIDYVLSLNSYRFGDFVDRIYPIELEIKDASYTDTSASYLDLHFEIDSEGRLKTKLRQKRLFQFSHCELSIYM